MDLSNINLPQLRTALENAIATDLLKARNDCICLLTLTNFSRVGEVANMTLTEVKEVAPGYLSVEAIQKLLHFFPSPSLSNNILCFLLGNCVVKYRL